MTKNYFILMFFISLPPFFTSCAEDVYENPVTIEDLYRQKVKELSIKYGINVRIDDQYLSKAILSKSLEDIERDIQSFASSSIMLNEVLEPSTIRTKMRIRRKKTLSEQDDIKTGSFRVSGSIYVNSSREKDNTFAKENINGQISGKVSWKYGNSGALQNSLSISISSEEYSTILELTDYHFDFDYVDKFEDITVHGSSLCTLHVDIYTYDADCSISREAGMSSGSIAIAPKFFANDDLLNEIIY